MQDISNLAQTHACSQKIQSVTSHVLSYPQLLISMARHIQSCSNSCMLKENIHGKKYPILLWLMMLKENIHSCSYPWLLISRAAQINAHIQSSNPKLFKFWFFLACGFCFSHTILLLYPLLRYSLLSMLAPSCLFWRLRFCLFEFWPFCHMGFCNRNA